VCGKKISESRSTQIDLDGVVARASSGDLEWVDPFIGGSVRHEFDAGKELNVEADVG